MQTCTHAHTHASDRSTWKCVHGAGICPRELVVERSSKLSRKRINYGQSCTHTPTIKVHMCSPSPILPAEGARSHPRSSPKLRNPTHRAYRHLGDSWCQTNLGWSFLAAIFPEPAPGPAAGFGWGTQGLSEGPRKCDVTFSSHFVTFQVRCDAARFRKSLF